MFFSVPEGIAVVSTCPRKSALPVLCFFTSRILNAIYFTRYVLVVIAIILLQGTCAFDATAFHYKAVIDRHLVPSRHRPELFLSRLTRVPLELHPLCQGSSCAVGFGVLVFWCFGVLVFWCFGVLVFWFLVFWCLEFRVQGLRFRCSGFRV